MQYLNSYYSQETNTTHVSISYSSGANSFTGTFSVLGNVTAETQEKQVAKAQQTILSIIDPTATILQLQQQSQAQETRLTEAEEQLPILFDGNTQTENLAYAFIANSNGKGLWPGQYKGQALYFDELKPGEYVPGQTFKFTDPSNDEKVGECTIGRVRNDWAEPFVYNGETLVKGSGDFYLLDGKDAYKQGLDILYFKPTV